MLSGFRDAEGQLIKSIPEVAAVDEYNNKILNTIPHAFIDLKEDIYKIMAVIEKYCKSFFKGKSDPYLETACHYELKIKDFKDAIDMHIDNIFKMADSYKGSGLVVKSFGFTTNQLARKCSCGDLPFVLMFPEACQNIQNACSGLEKWIEEDTYYADYIKRDIADLELKHTRLVNVIRELHARFIHAQHRHKTVKCHINELEYDLKKIKVSD